MNQSDQYAQLSLTGYDGGHRPLVGQDQMGLMCVSMDTRQTSSEGNRVQYEVYLYKSLVNYKDYICSFKLF